MEQESLQDRDPDEMLRTYAEIADLDRTPPYVDCPPVERPFPGQLGGVCVQLSLDDRLSDHPRLFNPDSVEVPAGGM